jgi:hypothetical protein
MTRRHDQVFRSGELAAERRGRPKSATHGLPSAVKRAVEEELQLLRRDLAAPKAAETDDFFGYGFSPVEKAKMRLGALRQNFAIRHGLLENSLTTPEVCKLLNGISPQTPNDRRAAGTLIGLKENGVWHYPEWQFDQGGPDGIVEGLPEILRALRMGTLGKMRWLSESHDLFGRPPIEELRSGNREWVLYEAERANAE